ncbi:EAL domain-containing protein [Veronia nyctiphanis]|nr:EAL domain-containing protein [Veronia nyctiphanis]
MQNSRNHAKQSLSKKLVKKSLFTALLLGLLSSLFFTYQGINSELNNEIKNARERVLSVGPSAALALYSMDQTQLETLLKGFETDPVFKYFEVIDVNSETIFRVDIPHAESSASNIFMAILPNKEKRIDLTLMHTFSTGSETKTIPVGKLEVEVDTIHLFNTAVNLMFGITTSTLISVMLTMIVLLVISHNQIIKALTQMSELMTFKEGSRDVGNYPIPDKHEDDEIGVLITSFNDVTIQAQNYMDELQKKTEKLRALSDTDPLTGLWNRRALLAKLTRVCRSDYDNKWVIVAVGIDGLKEFNDKFGHKSGDQLIKQYGQFLLENLPESAFVARASGDAYTIVSAVSSVDDELLDKIKQLQTFHFPADDPNLPEEHITAAVGISVFPEHAKKPEALIQCADVALFSAKNNEDTQPSFRFYSPELDLKLKHYMQLRKELHKILHDNAFYIVYQPKVALNSGKVVGAEVLFRLRSNPERAPFELLQVAEESGQIVRLGEAVIEMTFLEMKPYVRRFPDNFRVSINISPKQFHDEHFTEFLYETSKRTGFPLNRLDIEITETSQMTDSAALEENRKWLEANDVTVTLDDFGTGFASMEYLLHFGFDQLKIDRQFVMRLPDDDESRSIVSTIAYLAKQFGMTVVAEGIELETQEACLKDFDIEYGQGFLYARGIELDAFLDMVEFNDEPTTGRPAVNE